MGMHSGGYESETAKTKEFLGSFGTGVFSGTALRGVPLSSGRSFDSSRTKGFLGSFGNSTFLFPRLPGRGSAWGALWASHSGRRRGAVGVWLGAGGMVSHFIPLNPVRSRFFLMLDPLSRLSIRPQRWGDGRWASGWTRLCEKAFRLSVGRHSFIDDLILAEAVCVGEWNRPVAFSGR